MNSRKSLFNASTIARSAFIALILGAVLVIAVSVPDGETSWVMLGMALSVLMVGAFDQIQRLASGNVRRALDSAGIPFESVDDLAISRDAHRDALTRVHNYVAGLREDNIAAADAPDVLEMLMGLVEDVTEDLSVK